MTQIKKIHRMSDGVQVYPQTHTKAVIDDNGYTAESRLQAMQDEINQAQLEVVAVPSDLTPTENSSNWVTSGGVYNAIQEVQTGFTELEGILYDVVYEGLDDKTIDISTYTKVNAWIGANGNWSTTSGQQTAIIPTESYTKVSITSNSNNGTYFLFCKEYPTISNGTPYASSLCEGETGRRVQDANTTVVYNIPSDCTYIAIGCTSTASAVGIYIPSNFTFLAEGQSVPVSSVNRIERLEDAVLYPLLSDYSTVDVTDGGSVTSWLNSSGEWRIISGQLSYIVDVGQYSSMRITANADKGTYFLLCKTHPNVTSSNTSYIQYACAGEDGRRVQSANTTETYNLPSDCKYIVFGAKSASTQTDTYLPSLVEFSYATNTMLSKIDDLYEKIEELNSAKTIKILAVGNSFSRDALSYAPMVLKKMGINATIGILYHSSCSLQSHWENRESSSFYTLDYFNWSNGKWIQVSSVGLDNGLSYDNWDIVTFQQNSSNSMDYSTCQPYLDNLISYVSGKLHNIKIGWLLTHAWADGYSGLSSRNITSDQMAALVRTTTESVMKNAGVDILIPYGTAVQLARGNENLAQLGTFGEMSYDGVHLQEGIGCLIASYVSAKVISEVVGTKTGIHGNEVEPNASFLSTYVIPEQHGSSVGVSDENLLLGQKYAVQAYNNPLTILAG